MARCIITQTLSMFYEQQHLIPGRSWQLVKLQHCTTIDRENVIWPPWRRVCCRWWTVVSLNQLQQQQQLAAAFEFAAVRQEVRDWCAVWWQATAGEPTGCATKINPVFRAHLVLCYMFLMSLCDFLNLIVWEEGKWGDTQGCVAGSRSFTQRASSRIYPESCHNTIFILGIMSSEYFFSRKQYSCRIF